jgi:hypothetical protein
LGRAKVGRITFGPVFQSQSLPLAPKRMTVQAFAANC